MNPEDTETTDLASQDAAQTETDDDTDDSSDSTEEGQDASQEEPTLYAGKYKTVEEMEKAYLEIQKFTGSRKELEEKAKAYDGLIARQARSVGQSTVTMPKLSQFVQEDGSIDVGSYDKQMEQWNQQLITNAGTAGSTRAQELADLTRVERDFPYFDQNERAAKSMMALYRSGDVATIYEAAVEVDAMIQAETEGTKKKTATATTAELSKKIRGNTESPGGRLARDTGEMTEEKFAKLSLEERKAYVNKQFSDGKWNLGR